MRILAIDPGTEQSGWCQFEDGELLASGVVDNRAMLEIIRLTDSSKLAVEMVASYGMPVGREVFETVLWTGRFVQAWHNPDEVKLVYRKDVKMHLCGTPTAKDSNIRQAIIDLFPRTGGGATPQIGVKANPGPLYGVSTHAWPALGVAITVAKWDGSR